MESINLQLPRDYQVLGFAEVRNELHDYVAVAVVEFLNVPRPFIPYACYFVGREELGGRPCHLGDYRASRSEAFAAFADRIARHNVCRKSRPSE